MSITFHSRSEHDDLNILQTAFCSSTATPTSTFETCSTLPERTRRLVARLAREHRLRRVEGWPIRALSVYCVVFEVPAGRPVAEVVEALTNDARVESVQPMQRFEVLGRPASGPKDRGDKPLPRYDLIRHDVYRPDHARRRLRHGERNGGPVDGDAASRHGDRCRRSAEVLAVLGDEFAIAVHGTDVKIGEVVEDHQVRSVSRRDTPHAKVSESPSTMIRRAALRSMG